MSAWRGGLWSSQQGGSSTGGEVVVTADQQVPSIEASLGYVGENDDPVVTLAITDPAGDSDELRVYRSTEAIDVADLPIPLETLPPTTVSDDDATISIGTTYHYRLGSVTGGLVRMSVEVTVKIVEKPEYGNVGDEVEGGIYAGTITYADGREFHLIFSKQDGEAESLQWGNQDTVTGANDPDDGKANQNLILTSFDNGDSEAFYHCRDYVDGAGNNDYYLPAPNELAKADALIAMSHAEFSNPPNPPRNGFWTSIEFGGWSAWHRNLAEGREQGAVKGDTRLVRPIRRIPA